MKQINLIFRGKKGTEMKRTSVCVMLSACALILTCGCGAPANLIRNPGFEKHDEYDPTRPKGWNRLQSNKTTMFVDKSVFRSGRQSLSIISDPGEGSTWATKWLFTLDKGREYKFSLHTKWNGVGEGCSVRVYALRHLTEWSWSKKGKLLLGKVYKNREWAKHEAVFSMPEDADKLLILINPAPPKTPNNRIWVDDVSLCASGKAPSGTSGPVTKPRIYGKRPRIKIDGKSHALLLDGKPFLPIGICNPRSRQDMKEIKAQGFNTVVLADEAELIDKAHAEGLFVRFGINLLNEFREWEEMRGMVSEYKDHPALLVWQPKDEPAEMASSARACKIIKKADPTRPIAITAANPRTFSHLADMTDILLSCAYPIKKNSSVLTVDADWIDLATKVVKGKKPIWWILQAYEWEGDGRILPTVAQERCMTYLALIHGVKGFFYFSYPQMKRKEKPALWNSFKGLTAELKQLAPVILAATPKQDIKVTPPGSGLHYLLKQHKGRTYVFAANPENKEVKATFTLPKMKRDFSLSVLFEKSKAPEVTGNSFSDAFEGYGVHVYEIGP